MVIFQSTLSWEMDHIIGNYRKWAFLITSPDIEIELNSKAGTILVK